VCVIPETLIEQFLEKGYAVSRLFVLSKSIKTIGFDIMDNGFIIFLFFKKLKNGLLLIVYGR
jgi:hypothetical protein